MSSLIDLVRAELSTPVDPRVAAMAQAIAAQYPGSARAVLFYGSCLRMSELEGLMLDFYLIVSDYGDAYPKSWMAAANRLIPPNVFPFQHGELIAKYAVLSEKDFELLNSSEASNVSVWARFAQPSRLVWSVDHVAADRVIAAIAEAPVTLFELTMPTMAPDEPVAPIDIWRAGFGLTYQAELRAERKGRSVSIVDADLDRYERFALATLAEIGTRRGVGAHGEVPNAFHPDTARRRWGRLRRRGKALSIARLAKASLTYAGGIDYLAWKINRHAGTKIEIKPWQRRWPLVAALTLVPRLMKSGAIR
jgi:hypothetical protein